MKMGSSYSREFVEAAVAGSFKAHCIKDYAIKIGVPGRTLRRWRQVYSLGNLETLLKRKKSVKKKVKLPTHEKVVVKPSLDNFQNEFVYHPGLGFRKKSDKNKDDRKALLAIQKEVEKLSGQVTKLLED
jgi:transposase-like protein